MGRYLFGAIGLLVALGSIFILGVLVGGSWNAGMESEKATVDREAVEQCLPADDVDEFEKCLQES